MNFFPPLPLGRRIPDRLHAVSCSLPTMRDVIGYEEKDAATLGQMSSGYPRFVIHPLLGAVERHWRARARLGDVALWLVTSPRIANELVAQLAPGTARVLEHDGVFAVAHEGDLEVRRRARAFLQHAGGFLSSRAAEDYAAKHGLIPAVQPEPGFSGDARGEVTRVVARCFGATAPDDVLLAPTGMNAFWSTFRAINRRQREHGRDVWLQIGWLYLDTGAILQKFTGGRHVRVLDVHDRAAIESAFREHGANLAAVVTEAPTNPLMQTADLRFISGLARQHGALMLIDPSITSPFNVDVLPLADIALLSLTKFAANEGDVIAGAVVVSRACPDWRALHAAIAAELEPVYARDLARLAGEIGACEQLVPRLNAGARAVVEHLQRRHSGVRRLYWSQQPGSRENYLSVARAPERIGPVIAFEVEGPLAAFYDAVPIAKGPSFGIRTSLLCPFVYLAHYDLVTSAEGRRLLAAAKLPPELLRLSIGEEPPDAIIDALERGFAAAGLA